MNERRQIVQMVKNFLPIIGGPGTTTSSGGGGTVISVHHPGQDRDYWVGIIVDSGPDDADDFTDHRYWVQTARLDNTTTDYATARTEAGTWSAYEDTSPHFLHVAAANTTEEGANTHDLQVDDVVIVYERPDDTGVYKYYFSAGGTGDKPLWAKITGSSSIGDNRWSYSWTEQSYNLAGTWIDTPSGKTSADEGLAYNTIEANNSATGMQGNSIDLSALPAGFTIAPVAGTPVVRLYRIINCNGDPEFIFSYENGATGTCS